MAQLTNDIEESQLNESIMNESTENRSIKYMTLEKGPKRKYTRKSKTDDKAKALIDHMINEQTNEQTNEQEQIKEQSNPKSDFELFNEVFSECSTKANQIIQSKTIKERIDRAIIDLYEYRKFAEPNLKNKQITGHIVDLSLCKDDNSCIIDFDIDHAGKLNGEEKEKIRQNIFNNILPKNVGLVLSVRGEIHAYCNRNRYKLPTNRNYKVVIYDDNLEIDIFAQMYTHKDGKLVANRVVQLNSKVRITKKGIQEKRCFIIKKLMIGQILIIQLPCMKSI
ncbi:MAG: hypothetical protein EZS28_026076 [Streblomastix strix]|uniref:Uncharacterized protein n=1 Tax=Streblomastix strix TaxID=222440 RepID=A0A5J4V6T6_9EUKA|nr:MAG: hypothetical protein EZS28_026076 [Streblomastix strix]